MAAPTYRSKWPSYARKWDGMVIKPAKAAAVRDFVSRAMRGKGHYLEAEKDTGVPWWWIAIAAERESGQDFSRSLAQGDRWDRRSVHVPAGRGPFNSWREAAYDALVTLKKLDRVQDWRLEKALYYQEQFNGWGYHWKGLASPYIWGGTNIQQAGKYVADGDFNPHVWDQQLGCAAMLRGLMDMDPSIKPVRET